MKKILLRLIFTIIYILLVYYIVSVKTEKYSSNATVLIKNISKEQTLSAIGAILAPESSSASQDSNLLELYIRSYDVYSKIDKDVNLSSYYTSKTIDPLYRLYKDTNISFIKATKENLLKRYNADLTTMFEQPSSTFMIEFKHADAKTAQKVVKELLKLSSLKLNTIEKENSEVVLKFLEKQIKEKRKLFIESIKKLIRYQNRHNTIDPSIDVEQNTKLLANLEAELIKNEIEYKSKLKQLMPNSPVMKSLKSTISQTRAKIASIKKKISGKNSKKKLNVNVFDFEILKNEMEFNKEIYKQTLLKLEETKTNINKMSKNIIVVTNPTIAQSYSEPNKFMSILNVTIILTLLYGIISLLFRIVRSHRD